MNVKTTVLERVQELVSPALAEFQAELVDIQFVHEHGHWVLRLFVDKIGGITLDDCARISENVGRSLDASDVITQSYALEVSSPGIDRPLKKEADFVRFSGERADITLYAPVNGRRHFRGILSGVKESSVRIKDSEENVHTLAISNIAKAKLDPEITF